MITDQAEALEYLGRLADVQRKIQASDARIARAKALHDGRKRQRAELLKLRDRLMADTVEDRPLFDTPSIQEAQRNGRDRGPRPGAEGRRAGELAGAVHEDGQGQGDHLGEGDGAAGPGPADEGRAVVSPLAPPDDQPAGLLATPGAILGATANTLRPPAPDWRTLPISVLGLNERLTTWLIEDYEVEDLGQFRDMLSNGDTLEDTAMLPAECDEVREAVAAFRASQGWGPEDGIPEAWLAPPVACRVCGCTENSACDGGCSWVPGEEALCSSCEWLKDGPPPLESIQAAPRTIQECREIERKAKLPKDLAKRLARAEAMRGEARDTLNARESRYSVLVHRWADGMRDDRAQVAYELGTAHIRVAAAKCDLITWEGIVGETRNALNAKGVDKARKTRAGKATTKLQPKGGSDAVPAEAERVDRDAVLVGQGRPAQGEELDAGQPEGRSKKATAEGPEVKADPRDLYQLVVVEGGAWKKCHSCGGDFDHVFFDVTKRTCHRPRRQVFAIREIEGDWRDAPLWELDLVRSEREGFEEDRIDTVGRLSDHIRDHGWTFLDQNETGVYDALIGFKDQLERNHQVAEIRRNIQDKKPEAPKKGRAKRTQGEAQRRP